MAARAASARRRGRRSSRGERGDQAARGGNWSVGLAAASAVPIVAGAHPTSQNSKSSLCDGSSVFHGVRRAARACERRPTRPIVNQEAPSGVHD